MSARKYPQFAMRLLATASVLCLPVLHHSAAQDQPAAAPAAGLEEIVVVAQKRSVNIQKAPEAITDEKRRRKPGRVKSQVRAH